MNNHLSIQLRRMRIALISLTFFLCSNGLFSQTQFVARSNGYSAEKQAISQTKWLSKNLLLNKDQTDKIYLLNLKYLQTVDSLKAVNIENKNKILIYSDLYNKHNKRIKETLTTEQYSKYSKYFGL